jgi:iron complex outermembrane receptor protein
MSSATRLAVVLCFAILSPAAAAAQTGTVQGRVADSSGAAVVQASVVLQGGPRTYSNERGEFVLRGVAPGIYTMRVRRIGYDAPPITITVGEGQTIQQPIVMRRLAVALAAVEVVVGSRARHTAADELAVPVDVFTPLEIRQQGTPEMAQVLSQLSPSVNFPRQSVSDATEIVRPFTMRGLSPDHSLVLVNGKRRHHTALIHYYGAGQGAGSSGVDMNAIPAGAVERLEVLRDGAAAQYGSDAIAGVVNVVLKEGAFDPFLTADVGQYMTSQENLAALPQGGSRPSYPHDGRTVDVNGGFGFNLGRGAVGLFAEYRDRQPTNRAGPDPTDMFASGDADVVENGALIQKNNTIPQPNHHWGDGASKDLMTFASARLPFNEIGSAGLYAFGGFSKREGTGFGYFRPPSSERNWTAIYPNGFLPKFNPDVIDISGAGGIRGQVGRSYYDLGLSVGHNGFKYNLENTLNTSLGPCLSAPCAPGQDGTLGTADDPGIPNQTSFFAGELRLTEVIASLDASREIGVGLSKPANLAYGAAFRNERYQVLAGERASYINGFHPAADGSIAPSGSQVFPGFRPEDASKSSRNNVGVYVDLEDELAPKLLANVATRFERYSDFGNNLSGKLAMRFQPSPKLTLRSAVQTGFRAPSLNQSHYSSVVTNFKADPTTGNPVAFELGIFPVGSREARALGARPLKAEKSRNFSIGLAATPIQPFTLTADFYYIAVDDRIVLTGFLDTPEVVAILQGIGSRAEAAQYFTNAIDTRTRGLDVTGNYRVDALGGGLDLTTAFNMTRTKIPNENNIPLPPELQGTGEELIGRYDEGGLLAMTKERPDWRGTFTANYNRNPWSGLVRYSYYGKYTSSLYSYSGSDVQTYGGKGLTDVEFGYTFRGQRLAVGARNVFDVYPDRMSANNGFDIFPFPPASPFGYNGRFVYTRLELVRR